MSHHCIEFVNADELARLFVDLHTNFCEAPTVLFVTPIERELVIAVFIVVSCDWHLLLFRLTREAVLDLVFQVSKHFTFFIK